MKGFTLAAGLILATASTMGQTPAPNATDVRPYISSTVDYGTVKMPQVKKNFLWTLHSDNDGVLESCLGLVAQARIMLPQEDMKDIEATIGQLTTTGRTPVIRYKAFLASQAFASPEAFRDIVMADYESSDQFFTALAGRLQQTMLGAGTR